MATEPYIGEINLVSFDFAPKGWALCNGQLLPINQNQALFSILGTTYGGNGQTNFALPNLQGRTGVGFSNAMPLGQAAGSSTENLTPGQLPN
ncbi:MAG: tail fiber protein, partial [Azonexus sp.]